MKKLVLLIVLVLTVLTSVSAQFMKKRKIISDRSYDYEDKRIVETNFIQYGKKVNESNNISTQIVKFERNSSTLYLIRIRNINKLDTTCLKNKSIIILKCGHRTILVSNISETECGNDIYFAGILQPSDVHVLSTTEVDTIGIYYLDSIIVFSGNITKRRNSNKTLIEAFTLLDKKIKNTKNI